MLTAIEYSRGHEENSSKINFDPLTFNSKVKMNIITNVQNNGPVLSTTKNGAALNSIFGPSPKKTQVLGCL
jgi:hypothetical protein